MQILVPRLPEFPLKNNKEGDACFDQENLITSAD
jgi:hypothetical protein